MDPMFGVTVINPLGPTAMVRRETCAGYAGEEAVRIQNTNYGRIWHPTFKLIPLAFSTSGDYSSSAQDLIKGVGKLNAEAAKDSLGATEHGRLGIQAQGTGRRLCRWLSLSLSCFKKHSHITRYLMSDVRRSSSAGKTIPQYRCLELWYQ